MIELHLHFDGSLPVKTVWEQAGKQGISLHAKSVEELREQLVCPVYCKSLNEYLECFDLPLMVLQTAESIEECMEELVLELSAEKMLYAEIRFAPQLHLQKGLNQEQVVRAALAGMNRAMEKAGKNHGEEDSGSTDVYPPIKVRLILCCMRGLDNAEANRETVALTAKYLGKGVCACDLAGAEALFKTESFEKLFAYASELQVPFTIHAGEADGPASVWAALRFGAKRIGHGVRSIEDPELMEVLLERQICLECCPTSNIQTKAVDKMRRHPIREFLRKGLLVTINTDSRTVSNTTIAREVQLVKSSLGLSPKEERRLYLNAAEAAFITDKEKEELKYAITKII